MSKAIIIGAGIAGIAAAIRLAIKGHQVEVFEASAQAGGKLSEIRLGSFRFDAGPSLFTMPQYVDELFRLAGKNPPDYFQYNKLDTICNYFYEDGTRIHAFADPEKFAEEIAEKTNDSAGSVLDFLSKSRDIYEITNPVFLQRSLHKLGSYLNLGTLKSLLRFPQIDAFRSMNQANEARFKDSRTIRLFNRYATYNGSNPYQAPATLNIIPHFEQHFGAYFPLGGMYAIVSSLTKLAIDLGVKFHFNSYVDEIEIKSSKVVGISCGEQIHPADLVISNMDVWYTYTRLLKGTKLPARLKTQERSSSALIFYWGINASFAELGLHNIFFTEDYQEEFRQIWNEKVIGSDPTIYVHISSKSNPKDAPEGSENWFTMINVPSDTGQDWDELIRVSRKNIIEKLSRNLGRDISQLISCESVLDPRGIDSKTFSYQGSLYGSSSNSQFSAFLRHANFSSGIQDLYFAGGSVHPGGGIPLALLSAKIVDRLIK
ncbi:MAG: phytoene dehydrogenase [Sphingobacteriales bacterium 17-39-43]|uniref:1-hydroxycarotenoid 3,4-desaturase CrtD n=1 Tax=Daejeonella sp. TaxID=2805397 RepID=UPI000BD5CD39|nr:1-hydroxycarotenoid 3,4-desaturase CrtD [Daejeonella sp.]OYX97028.1 MAG: phytoene dehydrogenase [Sphingobacteriia bacterium 35-40-5]OYZ31470.1 MAG: phytoene dehydrogenase [Sphingobacteriales bacterium 16-39-50]OZA24724.1 MAG: phytoene dehydrogenase [Sphingobacteriales bacterium 17-39-43]HQT22631.1 phytoene desaturase family protein [Daejeonella sp.]HQT57679.1 phytoene desaturase family protein [Daejeonella sp.]